MQKLKVSPQTTKGEQQKGGFMQQSLSHTVLLDQPLAFSSLSAGTALAS